MSKETRGVSDLALEQYALGELPPQEAERVRKALSADEALRARLAALASSDREILAAHPPREMVERIRERMRGAELRARRPSPYFTVALPAAAAVLALLALFALREGAFPFLAGAGSEATRLKGGPAHLTVFRKTEAGAEEVRDGSLVMQRDILQIGYTAGEARYGVIFSVDGRGVLTFHLPRDYRGQPAGAPELEKQGQAVLPYAYELDDAPGFERFFFVSARSPFPVRDVERAARALAAHPEEAEKGSLRLPPGLVVQSLDVKKPR
jgi:hypothetical protein